MEEAARARDERALERAHELESERLKTTRSSSSTIASEFLLTYREEDDLKKYFRLTFEWLARAHGSPDHWVTLLAGRLVEKALQTFARLKTSKAGSY